MIKLSVIPKAAWHRIFALVFLISFLATSSYAEISLSNSGTLDLRGVETLNRNTQQEDPGAAGKIKFDASGTAWKFHSWLEGGWDGTVKRPARDRSLFKNYRDVYQSNTPYLEFKELYLQHASASLDLRAGIQRFAWGRLDEFPPNDLLNPWDYSQFLRKSLEDRKIGVPSLSATMIQGDWSYDAAWIPVFVPYRLPLPDERWSGISSGSMLSQIPNAEITPREPDLPTRTIENSSIGLRVRHTGDIEWALNLYHGLDTRPFFKTTALAIDPQSQPGKVLVDPGYAPDFHRITSVGVDSAIVSGDLSIRAEAAYIMNRFYNVRKDLWGYPSVTAPGIFPLNSIGHKTDVIDYGIGADYRLFEDGTLVMQAQQTMIMNRPETLYERRLETILWASLKAGFMNQKVETNVSVAYNPEHGATMGKANAWYIFTDSWKAGISAIELNGPSQSVFGRFSRNDQVEADLIYSW